MTMTTGFGSVPAEIIDMIAESLDVRDIQNVRLVSKVVGSRFTNTTVFLHRFEAQEIDLSMPSIERLAAISQHAVLRFAVKRLTVVAVVYDTTLIEDWILAPDRAPSGRAPGGYDTATVTRVPNSDQAGAPHYLLYYIPRAWNPEQVASARNSLGWLQERQSEQDDQNGPGRPAIVERLAAILGALEQLTGIRFDGAVSQGQDALTRINGGTVKGLRHPLLPRQAASALSVTMAALAQAQVGLRSLDIYSTVRGCMIESVAFTQLLDSVDASCLSKVVSSVTNLALSFSSRIREVKPESERRIFYPHNQDEIFTYEITPEDEYLPGDDPRVLTEDNFSGIPEFLKLMPQLETLNFHQFHTLKTVTRAYDVILERIIKECRFPKLTRCTLRGLHTTEELLSQFLDNHESLCMLELRYIDLTVGTWDSIFGRLGSMPPLQELRLKDLFAGGLINLAPRDDEASRSESIIESGVQYSNGVHVYTRQFDRNDLERGLKFSTQALGHALQSYQFGKWFSDRCGECGYFWVE